MLTRNIMWICKREGKKEKEEGRQSRKEEEWMEREENRENGKEGRREKKREEVKEGRGGRRREKGGRERRSQGEEKEGRKEGGRQLLPGRREGGFWPHTAHSSPSSLERYMTYIYFLQTQVRTWLAGWWHWSGSSSQPQCFRTIQCRWGPMMVFQSRQEACFYISFKTLIVKVIKARLGECQNIQQLISNPGQVTPSFWVLSAVSLVKGEYSALFTIQSCQDQMRLCKKGFP